MSQAYSHNGDDRLLSSLGLRTEGFERGWTDLGTVTVHEAEPDGEFGPLPATTVRVFVSAVPAQFWKFEITRPRDDAETINGEVRGLYEPLERITVQTGSGGFGLYWPTAKMIAEHMLDCEAQA